MTQKHLICVNCIIIVFIFWQLPYLQIASFANNKIMDTEGINHPLLEQLNLSCKYLYNLGRILVHKQCTTPILTIN